MSMLDASCYMHNKTTQRHPMDTGHDHWPMPNVDTIICSANSSPLLGPSYFYNNTEKTQGLQFARNTTLWSGFTTRRIVLAVSYAGVYGFPNLNLTSFVEQALNIKSLMRYLVNAYWANKNLLSKAISWFLQWMRQTITSQTFISYTPRTMTSSRLLR